MELGFRLVANGFRQLYWPEAQVWHHHNLSRWGHVRQQFRYGRGGHFFLQAMAAQTRSGEPIQPGTAKDFYLALGTYTQAAAGAIVAVCFGGGSASSLPVWAILSAPIEPFSVTINPMTNWPFFSVIIPAYGRPQLLAKCLDALAAQQYARDRFEIIVVDDGSPGSLEPVVEAFQNKITIVYHWQPNRGPAAARNAGAARAQGQYLAFTDDDCAPTSTWLHQLATQLLKEPDKMVGGYTKNALPRNPFSITSQLLIDYLYHHYNRTESRARFFTSNNFAVAVDLFWQVGGFDETMPLAAGEDRELCDRWLEKGLGMVYLPRAVILHAHNLRFFSFWRQHFNYGRGAWRYHILRSHRLAENVALESPSFYWQLVSFPLTMARDIRAYLLTGMLCCTQAANATGFFYERLIWLQPQKKKLP